MLIIRRGIKPEFVFFLRNLFLKGEYYKKIIYLVLSVFVSLAFSSYPIQAQEESIYTYSTGNLIYEFPDKNSYDYFMELMFMLRKLKIFTVVSFLSSTLITPVLAEDDSERGIACNPYTYISVNSKNVKTVWGPTVSATNNSSVTQGYTKTIFRTIYSSFGVTGTTEINMLTSSVGLSAEITYSDSHTDTTTYTVNVPAHSTVYMHYGTKRVYGNASKKRREVDCSVTNISSFNYDYGYDNAVEWWQ